MVVGLVVAIAATDVITTRLEPPHSDALVKITILIGFSCGRVGSSGSRGRSSGLARASLGAGFRVGAVAALVVAAAIVVLVAVPGSRSYFESDRVAADSTTERVLEPLVFIPLGTVVFEETIFRGVLLGVLLRVGITTPRGRRDLGGVRLLAPAARAHRRERARARSRRSASSRERSRSRRWPACCSRGFGCGRGSLVAPILGHIATNSFAYVGALVALHSDSLVGDDLAQLVRSSSVVQPGGG